MKSRLGVLKQARRGIFSKLFGANKPETIDFVKKTPEEAKDGHNKEIDEFKQVQQMREEAKALRERYEVKEEEGLARFDESLTRQLEEYRDKVAHSPQIQELTSIIAETNKRMQMRFKREH